MAENIRSSADASKDFAQLKVKELKDYLRNHGEYVSGKKCELIERAKGLLLLNKTANADESDVKTAATRHLQRLVSHLGETLTDPILLKGGWSENEELIPDVSKDDLYNYLVLNKQRTLDNTENRATRQLKAKVFYMDHHVHSVTCHEINSDCSHCFVKAKVIPSLPSTNSNKDPDHDVWVCLSKVSGNVHSALCDCTAGEGESCNHIAALLYALVDITAKKIKGLHASTSKKCLWKDPRKRKQSPCKSQNMKFKKHKFIDPDDETDEDSPSSGVGRQDEDTFLVKPVNHERFAAKLLDLHCAPHASWLLTQDSHVELLHKSEDISMPVLLSVNFNFADSCNLTIV